MFDLSGAWGLAPSTNEAGPSVVEKMVFGCTTCTKYRSFGVKVVHPLTTAVLKNQPF